MISDRSVVSPTAVVLISKGPDKLTSPEKTSSPALALRGTASPLTKDQSISLLPTRISPSTGMVSPGKTKTRIPTSISEIERVLWFPSLSIICATVLLKASSWRTPEKACSRMRRSRVRPIKRKNKRVRAASKNACSPCRAVSNKLSPEAKITANEIGTSMLRCPALKAVQAELKKGRPAKAIAGIAIKAESQ